MINPQKRGTNLPFYRFSFNIHLPQELQNYSNRRTLQNRRMYLVKTPPFVRTLFSDYLWHVHTTDKVVYLTFDDGPIPELTPWILDQLDAYDAKATFFCVGENVRKHPALYQLLLDRGHAVGNHTQHHLNGWLKDTDSYLEDVSKCDVWIDSPLFRPPYGKLKPTQAAALKKDRTIVLWDVLSGDFDERISPEKCLENVIRNYEAGSIIVFHDNIKAKEKLQYALPRFLDHLAQHGFVCGSLIPEMEEVF